MIIFLNLISGSLGGQLTRARAIIERIDQYDNIEIIITKNSKVLNDINNNKIKFINIDHGSGFVKLIRRFFWENFVMPGLVRELNVDIFLTFSNYLPLRKLKIPAFMGISNLAPFSPKALKEESIINRIKFFILKKIILYSSIKATKVIALSKTAVNVLISNGLNPRKIFLNPIGVDEFWSQKEVNKTIDLRYGIKTPYYLYVSHFYRYKNHFHLINTYANLSSEIKSKRQLVLIGRPENINYFNEVRDLIKKLDLNENIILIPGLNFSELRRFYQNAHIFIFCSLVENSPNILLEAMSASCAIVTVNIPPMAEYCSSCAEFYDEDNYDGLSQILTALDNNPKKIEELKIASLIQSRQYSWDHFVKSLLTQMQEFI